MKDKIKEKQEQYLKKITIDFLYDTYEVHTSEELQELLDENPQLDEQIKKIIKKIIDKDLEITPAIRYQENEDLFLFSQQITAYFHHENEGWKKYGEYWKACILTTRKDILDFWDTLPEETQEEYKEEARREEEEHKEE